MKLTHLDIHGFKSFADRVKLQFDRPITGIVGPNGCGKSNVVDAIRWVLGEQKTRNLRSDKMESVIFNGSSKRRKAGVAEVSITFENTRNVLPTEYGHVTVTRRLFRDGESEYRLNDVPCRLKDILNLFLDTGVGPDSYAIIELGMVEELLTDKNNSRRELFEEAAGVGKYKQRVRETSHKLEDTQRDLARLEDLLYELEKNLKSLEKQAARALKYRELKAQHRQAAAQAAWLRHQALDVQRKELNLQDRGLGDQETALVTQVAKHEGVRQQALATVLRREQELTAAQQVLNAHQESLVRVERDLALAHERLRFLTQRRDALQQEQQQYGHSQQQHQQHLAQLTEKLAEAQAHVIAQQQALAQAETQADAAGALHAVARQALDHAQHAFQQHETALRVLQQQQSVWQAQLESLAREYNRTHDDWAQRAAEAPRRQQRIEQLMNEQAQNRHLVTEAETRTEQHRAQLQQLQAQQEALTQTYYEKQRELDALRQELKLTRSLMESQEAATEAVKFLRRQPGWTAQQVPQVADLFYADDTAKMALEAVLEPTLHWLVVATRTQALAGLELLKQAGKGRAPFVILDELEAPPQTNASAQGGEPLLPLVEYNPQHSTLAYHLLHDVHLYHNLPLQAPPAGTTWVLANGTVVTRAAQAQGGSVSLFEGKRVGQARQLEKLTPQVAVLEEQVAALNTQRQELQRLRKTAEAEQPGIALQTLMRSLQQLERELATLQAQQQEHEAQEKRLHAQSQDRDAERQRLELKLAEAAPQLVQAQQQAQQAQQARAEALAAERDANQVFSLAEQALGKQRLATLQAQHRQESHQQELTRAVETQKAEAQRAESRHREQAELAEAIALLVQETHQHDAQLMQAYEHRQTLQADVATAEACLADIRTQAGAEEEQLRGLRQQQTALAQKRSEIKDLLTDLRIQETGVEERLEIEFGLRLAGLDPHTLFPAGESIPLAEVVEAQARKFREQVQHFGEVNATAEEQYVELKERYQFLITQRDDLLQAQANLADTLQEMDQAARKQFMEAFQNIQGHFQRVFRSLFSDEDHCELRLINPEEPLTSPIEIMAQPKGKRPLTINQLSGGEKTLTAISLLFAIYLLKPAPFCVFDEVDAPLDDANIDKFTHIIRDFSAQSQFIVVTHNKRTMARAQALYGVTMEETGVSRVLPVDLEALHLN